MANTYASVLAGLAPSVSYAFDEATASGPYLNEGSSGSLQLPGAGVTSDVFPAQQFGLIRNAPIEYGHWSASQATGIRLVSDNNQAGAPAANGWTTGTWSIIINRTIQGDPDTIATPMSQSFNSTDASYGNVESWAIRIDTNGRLSFTIDTDETLTGSNYIAWRSTANNVIQERRPYIITFVQRADGTGFHCWVNGAEVAGTTSIDGNDRNAVPMTVDACVDSRFGAETNTRFSLRGVLSGSTPVQDEFLQGCIQRPAVWRNVALSDAQIQSLHSAANLDGLVDDFYEYMLSRFVNAGDANFIGSPEYMNLGPVYGSSVVTSSNNIAHLGTSDVNAERMAWTGTRNGSNLTAGTGGVDKPVSRFPTYYQRSNDNSTVYDSGNNNVPVSSSQGTMMCLITLKDTLTASQSRSFMGYGRGNSVTDRNLALFFGQVAGGYTLFYTIGDQDQNNNKTGDYYQYLTIPGDNGLVTADFPHFILVTLTQDGTGIKMYLNDQELDVGAVSSVGTTFDADSWWNTLGTSSANRYAISNYPNNNDGVDETDVHFDMILPGVALSAAQIAEVWNAVNGSFPAGPVSPPDGGFNDTLTNTGNETDPNGPGPNHYWRMNALSAAIIDVGISTVSGNSRALGGDPLFQTQGPLINDPTNAAIYFDGSGDYFEIGVDAAAGRLVSAGVGTVGFFVSVNDFNNELIAYSQANDAGTEFINFGVDGEAKPFMKVQTSAGNSVTFTGTNAITNRDYVFVVFTGDGTNLRVYIDAVQDTTAVLTLEGTGADGDWFDTVATVTRSAVAALANSTFTTATDGQFSEIFIYEEVLTAAQIGALFDAAVQDGINTDTNTLGVLDFEDVKFINGGAADVRCVNPLTTFQQVVKIDGSRFTGGAQGTAAQSILLSGVAKAQVKGSSFNLNDTPVAGRAAIHATVADPTAAATTFSDVIVDDCTFDRMGRAADPAVYLEAGFGMSVENSRFFNSLCGGVGWRGDARRVSVLDNVIDTVSAGLGGIYVRQGLNTQIGTAWNIARNTILDVAVGDGILIDGGNSSLAQFARNIRIADNLINTVASEYINIGNVQDALLSRNQCADGAVDGIRIQNIAGVVTLRQNSVKNHTGEGIRMDEASLRAAALVLDDNMINGVSSGDGVQVNNVATLIMLDNQLVNCVNGLTLGTIGTRAKVRGNDIGATTPLVLSGAQAGLDFGDNNAVNLAALQALTVVSEAVNVSGPYHTITAGSATNLTDIGGVHERGKVVILLLATGSSQITLVDGANLTLAGNFIMGDAGTDNIWLVSDGTNWVELDRRDTA